jgi:hypothetical protein
MATMNKFVRAIKVLDLDAIKALVAADPSWLTWAEESGKNGLHYLTGIKTDSQEKQKVIVAITEFLLNSGMNINSIHQIPDERRFFPATPLWYSYTRGKNKPLYSFLLRSGANPENCMFAIAWNNDLGAAKQFMKHGALIDEAPGGVTPFLSAFLWKHFDIASWFLSNGAKVNFRDFAGNTALHYAILKKFKLDQIKLLLDYSADIHILNNEGVSPYQLAQKNSRTGVLDLLGTTPK